MLEFVSDFTWLTFIDSLDQTVSSIKHWLSSLRIGVLQASGLQHESTDNSEDKSLNTLMRMDSSNSYEWYAKESTFSDSQWQHIHVTFENCKTLILHELSSMHSEWYHSKQLSQHTALWLSQVTGNSQQPQEYIDVVPGLTCVSPDKIIIRSVSVFDCLDIIKDLFFVRCKHLHDYGNGCNLMTLKKDNQIKNIENGGNIQTVQHVVFSLRTKPRGWMQESEW